MTYCLRTRAFTVRTMPSQNLPPLKIVLAANSPLYAPLFLAKAEKRNQTCARLRFEIAGVPRADRDPFVESLASRDSSRLALGVGDPARLCAYDCSGKGQLDQPFVLFPFIRRTCCWIIDRSDEAWDTSYRTYRFLLTHPKGMTGYVVPFAHLDALTSGDATFVSRHLWPVPDLRHTEHDYYRAALTALASTAYRLAHVSLNPLDYINAQRESTSDPVVKNFLDKGNDAYDDVVFTAIIAGSRARFDDNHQYREAIHELRDGLNTAIAHFYDDPEYCAYRLYDVNTKTPLLPNEAPFFLRWTFRDFAASLRFLADNVVFPYPIPDTLPRKWWSNTTAIHHKVEPFLPLGLRKTAVKDLDVCCNLAPAAACSHPQPISVGKSKSPTHDLINLADTRNDDVETAMKTLEAARRNIATAHHWAEVLSWFVAAAGFIGFFAKLWGRPSWFEGVEGGVFEPPFPYAIAITVSAALICGSMHPGWRVIAAAMHREVPDGWGLAAMRSVLVSVATLAMLWIWFNKGIAVTTSCGLLLTSLYKSGAVTAFRHEWRERSAVKERARELSESDANNARWVETLRAAADAN